MKHKHLIAIFLVMTMMVGMLPTCVFAKDEDVEVHWFEGSQNAQDDHSEEIPPQTDKEEKPSDNDELFKGYVENRLEKEKVNNRRDRISKRFSNSGNN